MSEQKTYSISKYLSAVKRLVTEQIPTIWVHGVITQVSERGRMVYLGIAEYVEGDVKPVASLPLFIFASDYGSISQKLEKLPVPFRLQPELKVNLLIQADFYVPQGKFQARVLDIDPVYTLGELALTRQAILERLVREGLRDRNRMQPMPAVPLKIGLITGEGTAAYQDFITVLQNSGFAFEVATAWARMQGAETENTILTSLGNLRQLEGIDVVCIVRGGGSRTDLNFFDSEALCRAVALFPVPVLTGIGHEIDKSLLDIVAWESRITPTDCAKFLVRRIEETWGNTQAIGQEVARCTRERLQGAQRRLDNALSRMTRALPQRLAREKEKQTQMLRDFSKLPLRRFLREQELLERNKEGLIHGARKILQYQSLRLDLLAERTRSHDPARMLARGFSLSTDTNGNIVRSVKQLSTGDRISTRFSDGTVFGTIDAVESTPEIVYSQLNTPTLPRN